MAQSFFMQAKKESWLMLKLLLLMNIILIAAIVLMHSSFKSPVQKEQSCDSAKPFNADALNSITVKLM